MLGSSGDRLGAAAGPSRRAPLASLSLPPTPPWAVAASVFAGVLGTGVVDGALVLIRESGVTRWSLAALALGLYGALAIVAAVVAWGVVWATLTALPGGPRRLVEDVVFDGKLAAAILAGLGGAVFLGLTAAAAQGLFIGRMASRQLAVIATFGLTLALAPAGVVVALALGRPARAVAGAIPRGRRIPRTVLVLVALALGGTAAGLAALSRADWRVLDLGPLEAIPIAIGLAVGHGLFWYVWGPARRLHARLPRLAVSAVVVSAIPVLLAFGALVPEGSPVYEAIDDGSLGLRFAIKMARALTDRDGDGFSARFGGGDCDDHQPEVYPGAEDRPGDGIDQDCQGGDARPEAAEPVAAAAPPEPKTPVKPAAGAFTGNLLLISIDALRADRLGVAGYGRPSGKSLTPTLDALARRGTYFRRVWSQAPNTPRSFPSMVTSRYPSDIAWQQRSLNYSPILPSNRTFFERLARGGWKPIGIFSHFYFSADRGLSKAFAEWSNDGAGTIAESNKDIASPRIVPRVVARLTKAAAAHERFALWTHLFEPHSSYMEHPEFPTSGGRGAAALEEKYDYEIAYVDRWVGKILAALDQTGLAESTAVVVWADHGEAWGEHKRFFHGQDLTEEQLRVPLIIAVPGQTPATVEDEVGLVDVAPTLLDLVGLPAPATFRGRSLLPRVRGKPLPPRPVFAELLPASAWPRHETMIVDRGRKLTHRISDRRWDLHDLHNDPKQHRNLIDDPRHRRMAEELKGRLLRFEEGKR
jgi:arylsulfatase A-like enzyme